MIDKDFTLDKGIFTLSLDTELGWGRIDKPHELERDMKYYLRTREVIEEVIKLLTKYNISATWAIVGHLFLDSCSMKEGQKHPEIPRSKYPWYNEDWFHQCPCTNWDKTSLWYGRDIIESILSSPVYQEIGCHSFSHIPFGYKNTKRETVKAELKRCIEEAEKKDLILQSFIFPRNQEGFFDELNKAGFKAFRGSEPYWYRNVPRKLKKIAHILDQVLTLCPPVVIPHEKENMINIPGSMMYLPMNGFRRLIPINSRIIKAKRGIRKASKEKKIFHLWFHPFNIATNPEKLLYGLEEIFKEVAKERSKGNLEVKTMGEIARAMNIGDVI